MIEDTNRCRGMAKTAPTSTSARQHQAAWPRSMRVTSTVLSLVSSLFWSGSAHAETDFHPDYKPIVPGLDYSHIRTINSNNGAPLSIHIARLERGRKELRLEST